MRVEKKYLIEEVQNHLKKSDYVILTNYSGITVDETAELREKLAEDGAEFHVVKNSSLKVAAKALGLPEMDESLEGPTAIIVGGTNSPGAAKAITSFIKDKKKLEVKSAVLGDKLISADEVKALAELPSLDALRGQLLGLLNQPGTMLVRVLSAPAQQFANVLQAKVRAEGGED
ncbi:50S ribosomal protein L10 [Synoicihabitans lomoniglobus]|uniref:Large ribosomal subunit protein uL10 n=1 Tax=Synoicihabitans lomoniglobus TaxID=2909285 RepID=A0AAE9ZYK9_9BACT|nr:50S ribosomal protein L10 [Opitutaceae bacterium LMO-M01]WED65609.1 50S ribosomal protein L10 [Opitutaceae bacterium LMO-M01]